LKFKTTKAYYINDHYIPKDWIICVERDKIEEAFASGAAPQVIEKMLSVLSKRIGTGIDLATIPYNYSNSFGSFSSYLGIFSNGKEAIRINFSLGKSDRIVSCDYFKDINDIPTHIDFDVNDNIIKIVSAIEDVILEGVEENPLYESLQERSATAYNDVMDWLFSEEKINSDLVQNTRLSNVYKYDYKVWAGKEGVKAVSLPSFMKGVKQYLDENRLENKYLYKATIQKGDKKETQIVSDKDEKEWLKNYEMTVEEKYEQLKEFIGLIIKGYSRGFIVSGPPGIGKTYTTLEELKKAGIKPVYASGGFKSVKDMYLALFRNREDKVIVMDDFDDAFKKKDVLNLLKAALDTDTQKPNMLTYLDKDFISAGEWNELTPNQQDKKVPSTFVFESSLIMITNLPINRINSAILDRALAVDIDLSKEEVLARIKTKLNSFPPECDPQIKLTTFEFLLDNVENLETLNFRQFEKVAMLASTGNPAWQKWAFSLGLIKGKGGA
jgi:hypothetical protein